MVVYNWPSFLLNFLWLSNLSLFPNVELGIFAGAVTGVGVPQVSVGVVRNAPFLRGWCGGVDPRPDPLPWRAWLVFVCSWKSCA